MNDGLLVEIKYLAKRLEITSLIEVVADPKALQILVAVELFIVGVGHLRELCFVLFIKDSHGVATEIGPRHGNDVSLGLRHERMDCLAHDVRIIGYVVASLSHVDYTLHCAEAPKSLTAISITTKDAFAIRMNAWFGKMKKLNLSRL